MKTYFITGSAGFIGSNLAKRILTDEKDVMVIIKDRYQLLKINITKEDLDKDNLNGVIDALEKIKMNQNLLKNNINIDELESECEFGKILKSK